MKFSAGDKVRILGPTTTGCKIYVDMVGEIRHPYNGAYVIDIKGIDKTLFFAEENLRLAHVSVFESPELTIVEGGKEDKSNEWAMEHRILIKGVELVLTTKEAKHLKNILEVFV